MSSLTLQLIDKLAKNAQNPQVDKSTLRASDSPCLKRNRSPSPPPKQAKKRGRKPKAVGYKAQDADSSSNGSLEQSAEMPNTPTHAAKTLVNADDASDDANGDDALSTASASGQHRGNNDVTDEGIKAAPRRFGIELQGNWSERFDTRRDLCGFVEKNKPKEARIREVLKTLSGKILIFPESAKDFNILIKKEKWNKESGINPTPSLKTSSKTAIIILGVESCYSVDEVLEEMRIRSYNPSGGTRMKRASDGLETTSLKIFLDSETEMEKAIKEGIFLGLTHHPAKRYIQPTFNQCFRCQSLGHSTQGCQKQRRCMKCGDDHHHRSCLRPPSQFKCANCSLQHAANDQRCEVLRAARTSSSTTNPSTSRGESSNMASTNKTSAGGSGSARSTEASGERQPQQTPTTESTLTASINQNALLKDEIKSIVKEAVGEAMKESFKGIFQEAMKSFAEEMGKTAAAISSATSNLLEATERYVRKLNLRSMVNLDNKETFKDKHTSTPIASGRQDTRSNMAPLSTASVMTISRTEADYVITLPPTEIKISKSLNKGDLSKAIVEECNARGKILKKDLKEAQEKINSMNISTGENLNISPNQFAILRNGDLELETSNEETLTEDSTTAGEKNGGVVRQIAEQLESMGTSKGKTKGKGSTKKKNGR